jgi:hypothetical protein
MTKSAANLHDKLVREGCEIRCTGRNIFIMIGSTKIAKRGHPGTPQAKTWISLQPGWRVFDNQSELVVEYNDQQLAALARLEELDD